MKKDSFKKKLAAYIVMSEAFLLAHPVDADAQIMYTDVNPDALIYSNQPGYALDLNNDGVTDFYIQKNSGFNENTFNGCSGNTSHWESLTAQALGSNEFLGGTGYCAGFPIVLNFGSVIGIPQQSEFTQNGLLNHGVSTGAWTCSGSDTSWFTGSGCFVGMDAYLGLKLVDGGHTYYGWVRLNTGIPSIKDYAINLIPDSSIIVGETNNCLVNNNYTISPSGDHVMCNSDSLTVTLQNASGQNIQWLQNGGWMAGETDSLYTLHQNGDYEALIFDSTCSVIVTGIHAETEYIFIDETWEYPKTCDNSNGYIYATVLSNAPGVNFNWSNGETTQSISSLSEGQYQLTVTSTMCSLVDSAVQTFFIYSIQGFTLSETHIDSVCEYEGSIDITVSGGTPNFNFEWNTSNADEDLNNLSSGIYMLTVTDGNGCSEIISVSINNLPIPSPGINQSGNTLIETPVGVSYQWYLNGNTISGATDQQYDANQTGYYSVVLTDANGCTGFSAEIYFQPLFVSGMESNQVAVTVDQNKNLLFHLADNSLMGNQIDILNGLGQLVTTVTVTNQTPEADLSTLPAGIYFFHIRSKQKTYSGKFFIE